MLHTIPGRCYVPVTDRRYVPTTGKCYVPLTGRCYVPTTGSCYAPANAQWLERRTRDRKVAGSSPGRIGGIKKILRGQLSVLTLISVSVPPRVTAVARKKSRSFCQKCKWLVTSNHVALHEVNAMVHGLVVSGFTYMRQEHCEFAR